jgi:hypothetical protein
MLVWGCTRSFGWLWSEIEFRVRAGVNDLVWDGEVKGLGLVGSVIPASSSASMAGRVRRSKLLM